MATFDASKLSKLDWGVIGAGGIGLIALFLPWYGVSAGFYSASVSGWSTSYGWLGAILIIAAGVYLLLQRAQVNLPKLPVGAAVLVLGASLLGTLIVGLRWITLPSGHAGVAGVTYYSYGPRVGIILTLIVGIVQVVCAFALFRASGEAVPWATPGQATAAPMPTMTTMPTPTPTPPPTPQQTDDTTDTTDTTPPIV
jgi:hypothetical protein